MINAWKLRDDAQDISVLFVEDDQNLRENTARLLESFVSVLDTAENGQEGLIKYNKNNYDLVITDINMPVMDGIKMTREIKKRNSKQVIIILSAHDDARYLLSLINLGIDSFILKPLDLNLFLEALDKCIKLVKYSRLEEDYKKNLEKTIQERTRELSESIDMEISNLTGNISVKDGEVYLHIHINLSDISYQTLGGHLNSAYVSGACEIIIDVIEGEVGREVDPAVGLNLFKLD
jgi:putative two-component system response regulator